MGPIFSISINGMVVVDVGGGGAIYSLCVW